MPLLWLARYNLHLSNRVCPACRNSWWPLQRGFKMWGSWEWYFEKSFSWWICTAGLLQPGSEHLVPYSALIRRSTLAGMCLEVG